MNATKQAILNAFWQLLEEKPYSKITVQNIAERCHINRNTFYYHFSDIPALAIDSIQDWIDDLLRTHCELGAPDRCVLPLAAECTRRRHALLHLYCSVSQETIVCRLYPLCERIVRTYLDYAAQKTEIPVQDRETVIRFYKCTMAGILTDWLESGASYDLQRFCADVCASFSGSGMRALLRHTNLHPDSDSRSECIASSSDTEEVSGL